MKRVRIYLCIMIYVGLTCAKLVFPASAADLRSTVRSQIATDDRTAVYSAALLHRVSDPVRPAASEPYTVQTPLEQMEAARAAHAHAYFDYLPERQLHVEPSQAVAEELASAARLDAAYAAREAFLAEQAAFSDRAVPANVSYDISELPFQTVTPVAGVCSSGFGYRISVRTSPRNPARRSAPLRPALCLRQGRTPDTETMSSSITETDT